MHRLRIVSGMDRDGGEPGVAAARAMRMAISPRLAIAIYGRTSRFPFDPRSSMTFPAQKGHRFSFLLPDMKPCCDADASGILFRATKSLDDPT
jgi:hypothetical protein